MSRRNQQDPAALAGVDRRAWLLRAAAGGAVFAGLPGLPASGQVTQGQDAKRNSADEAAAEFNSASARVRAVTGQPPQTATSDQYQTVGDASASFMKIALADCDEIAREFLDHYQAKGFRVQAPGRRLTIVAFRDERPFFEYARSSPAVCLPTSAVSTRAVQNCAGPLRFSQRAGNPARRRLE